MILAEETIFARNLGNERADVAHPAYVESLARATAAELGLKITVLSRDECESLGMHLLVAVGQAATVPPRLVVLEYNPFETSPAISSPAHSTIALVGKVSNVPSM